MLGADRIVLRCGCVCCTVYFAEGKPAFSRRAVDHMKERAERKRAQTAGTTATSTTMTGRHWPQARAACARALHIAGTAEDELDVFMDTLRQSSRTPLEKVQHGSYNAHWRGQTRGYDGERATLHNNTASEGVNMRSNTPIQSSHDIGWHTKPLVRHAVYAPWPLSSA